MFIGFNLFGDIPKAAKVEPREHDLPPTAQQRRAENKVIADRAMAIARQKLQDGVITPEEYNILTNPTRKDSIPLSLGRANREATLAGGKRRRRTQRRRTQRRKARKGKKTGKTHRRKGAKGRKAGKNHRRRR